MKVKQLREYLNKLDPSFDGAPVVASGSDHSYFEVSLRTGEAEKNGRDLSEYPQDGSTTKIKVLVVA